MSGKQILAIIGVVLLLAAITVGCWFGYWAVYKQSVKNQYDVNTHTQQYQSSLVQQERDFAQGYNAATDPAQKAQIRSTFCSMYTNLDNPPADLASAQVQICEAS